MRRSHRECHYLVVSSYLCLQLTRTRPEPFEHDDPGHRADPTFPNLFKSAHGLQRPVTPAFGTEITGVQLTELSPAGLDELALLCAQRGFAVFRGQDWKDAGFEKQLDIARCVSSRMDGISKKGG